MLEGFFRIVKKEIRDYRRERFQNRQAFKGYTESLHKIKYVDFLSDSELMQLNNILSWNCFTVDRHGRRFGRGSREGKRSDPEVIPDRRILLLNERFNLAERLVLEIGCFEGIHTIGLSMYAKKVLAIDARIENVVKTIVRCSLFGYHPTVFKLDVEKRPLDEKLLAADVAYHVGVLYHLKDPVRHLLELGGILRAGLLLDTHYALDEEAVHTYEVNSKRYRYKKYREGGYADVFSGIYDHSKWLRLEDIMNVLRIAGFRNVNVIEERQERNGPRVLLMAERN